MMTQPKIVATVWTDKDRDILAEYELSKEHDHKPPKEHDYDLPQEPNFDLPSDRIP